VVPLPDVEAFLGGGAGLLEVRAREPLEKARGDDGVLQAPAAVRVGDHGVDVPGGFDVYGRASDGTPWWGLAVPRIDQPVDIRPEFLGNIARK
jgi:hypothetical protein